MKKDTSPAGRIRPQRVPGKLLFRFPEPLYVSLILSRLDGSVIAVGSFMSSAFPVLVGAGAGQPRRLPEAVRGAAIRDARRAGGSARLRRPRVVDLRAYYLVSMFVLGTFSSSVVYLLQKIKEVRYRRNRASFDRRVRHGGRVRAAGGFGPGHCRHFRSSATPVPWRDSAPCRPRWSTGCSSCCTATVPQRRKAESRRGAAPMCSPGIVPPGRARRVAERRMTQAGCVRPPRG